MTREEFNNAIIAQDDDNDYQESGYVVLKVGDLYQIFHYSHCNCFDTFDALCGGGYSNSWLKEGTLTPKWEGDLVSLKAKVLERLDVEIPNRKADPKDYDYDHLMNVYDQLVKYFKEKGLW